MESTSFPSCWGRLFITDQTHHRGKISPTSTPVSFRFGKRSLNGTKEDVCLCNSGLLSALLGTGQETRAEGKVDKAAKSQPAPQEMQHCTVDKRQPLRREPCTLHYLLRSGHPRGANSSKSALAAQLGIYFALLGKTLVRIQDAWLVIP